MGNSLYLLCRRGAGAGGSSAAYDATAASDPDGVYGACEEPLSEDSDTEIDGGDHTVYESRVARAAAVALAKAASMATAAVGGSGVDSEVPSSSQQQLPSASDHPSADQTSGEERPVASTDLSVSNNGSDAVKIDRQ
ncbi:hypothetical protein BOX15_Mlig034043g1 [Macrostomum lignano]|uniref:Uncharacterized protein n=1 Tax=Macrostomum lignano TaxID=282301 RepID=A0A267GY10_9PLAT|nr:hypothetical protein BOX15_Mlig034043g1 [Macrostomum lignano]